MTQLLDSITPEERHELFPALKNGSVISIVRAAGLLHDLGHGPFSHSSEDTMLKALREQHSEEVSEAEEVLANDNSAKLPVHEYFSYKLMTTSGELKEILDQKLGAQNVAALVTKTKQVKADVAQNSNGLSILRKIVSSQLDADRMDYITRDAAWAGVTYGSIDTERVIGNMALRKIKDNYELVIHERALNAVESVIDSRFKMYKWVYHHHMVVATEELAQRLVDWVYDSTPEMKPKFHWRTFEKGEFSDIDIEFALKTELGKESIEARVFKGFNDRRYLPVSLLKRREDHEKLQKEIRAAMGSSVGSDYIARKFDALFNDPQKSRRELRDTLSKLDSSS